MELKCAWLLLLLFYTDITLSDKSIIRLQEGTNYVYNLEGITETSIPKATGPNGESSKLSIRAKVEVNAQAQGLALIRLKNVQVIGPDDKKFGSLNKLEQNPLRVKFEGGKLQNEVSAVKDDDYTSLNIKRAVASLLQVSLTESGSVPHEFDVYGSCPTNYDIRQDGDATVVRKNRNLNRCAYRENIRQEFFSIPNAGFSDLQSTPLLDPAFQAEIRVKGGVVESASVKESYLFRPFAERDNGAKTKVTTKLTLESKAPGAIADSTNEKRSIIFENPHETVSASIQTVLAALHKVVDNSDKAVGDAAARNFNELVSIIRRTSADDLLSVYGQVKAGAGFKNKQLAKKVISDGLFRAGSGDSVAVALELLKSKELSGPWSKLWYLSFAFARHASSNSLEKAASLFDDPNIPQEAYLGIGALAGRYCQEHPCANVPQFRTLLSKLAAPLAKPVPSNKAEESKLLASLKGLRNVKSLTADVAEKVAQVIGNLEAPTRVRAAALETAQPSCLPKLQEAAGKVFENREEDAELRIKAFLVLVECPNAKFANKLSSFIETEPVNQVGAFVTSYLRNLRATAKPDRQAALAVLQNVKPRRRFPIDLRRYSQNFEVSYDIDAVGSSASADANLIYSQKSYIPRSANLNLTVELFGHAFNLYEITGRAQNLERVVEHYFGPKGYLKTNKVEDIFKDGETRLKDLKQRVEDKYKTLSRSSRSVSRDEINNYLQSNQATSRGSKFDDDVDLDISLRVLGNELLWYNMADNTETTPEGVIDKVADMLERRFRDAKNFDQRIQNHNQFLDVELVYPTATGLPVKLTATGTSVVHLKVGGSMDIGALLRNPKDGEAKFELRPSASVEVVGQLSVDAYAVESGLKIAGNLHTATGTEISLKLLDGQGIDLNIGLPVKDSDILTITTEVLSTVRERGLPQTTVPLNFLVPRKDFQGCFDQLLPVIGLTLCGKVGFPSDQSSLVSGAAFYPLNGHSKVSLRIEKEDESLTSYHIRLQFNLRDATHRRIEALIETPGSKTPRELSILAEAKTAPTKEINLKIKTPIYDFLGQAKIVDTDSEYSLSGLAELSHAFVYKARVGLLINGATYTPVLEVSNNEAVLKPLNIEGTVTVDKSGSSTRRKYTFNNVRISDNRGAQFSADGFIANDVNLFQTDLKLGYDKETVSVKSKLQRQGTNNLKVVAEVVPSQYPDLAFALKYEYQRDKNHLENSLTLNHGRDLTSKDSKLSVIQQISYNVESIQRFDISTKNRITYQLLNVDIKLEGAATQKSLSYDLAIGNFIDLASKLSAKTGITKPGDYELNFMARLMEHAIAVESKRDIVGPNKSKFSNSLELTPGGKYILIADVTHQLDKNNVDTRLEVAFTVPGAQNPYKLDIGAIVNPSDLEAHSKIEFGGDTLIDALVKQRRIAPLSGNFKFNLRNVIESNGEYKRVENKASGNAIINVLPLKRKIKGSADLNVAGTKHTGGIEILYDADKDPSKKLHIETDTDLASRSINSKNKIHYSGQEVLLNFNGESNGKFGNGGVSGGYDITLANGLHLVARGKEVLNLIPGNSNGELFLEIGYSPKKGSPLTKITLDTFARNVDFRRYAFDTKFDMKLACDQGDAAYSQSVKSVPQDGKTVIDLQNSFSGTRLGEYQYNGKTKLIVSKEEISYHSSAALGQKYSLDLQGKVFPGYEKKYGFEATLTAHTPVDKLKEIKSVTVARLTVGDSVTSPCQLKLAQELNLDGKVYKFSTEGQGTKNNGNFKGALNLGDSDAYNAQLGYKHTHDKDLSNSELTFDASHAADKLNLNLRSDYNKELSLINVHATAATPFASLKKIDTTIGYKKLSAVAGNLDVKLNINEESLDLLSKVDLTPNHPILDFSGLYNGAKYRFYWKMDKKSERAGTQEGQIIWLHGGGGQYDYTLDIDLENLENFFVLIKLNSKELKLNKFKIEFGNKPLKGGAASRVNINAQNADGKIFSGSASYAIKESDSGWSVDGKGSATVGNDNYPLNYKIVFVKLNKAQDKENGFKGEVVVDFGKGSYRHNGKHTENSFIFNQKYCWDKKCNENDYVATYQLDSISHTKQVLSVKLDNKLFGEPFTFGLVSKAERNGLIADSEASFTLNDISYAGRAFVHSTEAGVVLNVPTREIAAVATYELPDIKKEKTTAKLDASLYLDRKKSPNDKASLHLEANLQNHNNQASGNALAKFSHPSLSRELVVKGEGSVGLDKKLLSGNVEIDVLNKKNQKITLNIDLEQNIVATGRNVSGKVVITSKGLTVDVGGSGHVYSGPQEFSAGSFIYFVDDKNIKKDAGVLLAASLKNAEILLRVPGHTLIEGDAFIRRGQDGAIMNAELTLAEGETGVLMVKVNPFKEISACLHPKSNPNRKVQGRISATPELFEVRAERVENDKSEVLFFSNVRLDQGKLFKIDYDFQAENIKKSVAYFQNLSKDFIDRLRAIIDGVTTELNAEFTNLLEALKKAQPNFKPLIQQYQTAFKAIKEELEKDKIVQELAGIFKKMLGGSLEAVEAQIKQIIKLYEKISHDVVEVQEKFVELYKKTAPDVIKAFKKLLAIYTELVKGFLEIGTGLANQILEIIRQNEADIKLILTNAAESFQDIGRVGIESFTTIRNEIQDFVKLILDELKSIPAITEFQDKVKELLKLELPAHFWELFDELSVTVEEIMPTPELKSLVKSIFEYIAKRLRHQPVDDVAVISSISKQAALVVDAVIKELKDRSGVDVKDLQLFGIKLALPLPATSVLKLPELGNIRFSPLNLLAAINEWPSPLEFYYAYRPTINPLDQIPPYEAYGLILSSHHFITFDKRHFAFKGSCSYVLAQDLRDNNFTIIANLENGKLRSITFADKTDVVEMFNDNTVKVNGKAGDYPVNVNEINGWRRYNSVNIKLKAGVFVTKYIPQDIYVIRVNGFYFGRTRGLLGTISNEQYDDFTLPNGHIATSSAEFGNAYQVKQCAAIPEMKIGGTHAPDCTAFFTSESSLSNYFGFLNPEPYREACDQHVAMMPTESHKAACLTAAAYVTGLREEGIIFAAVPSVCAKCTVAGKQLELGQTEQITSPTGKADVVLVVEQSQYNAGVFKELVTPLIATLSTDLKEKGLTDVEYALIGFGGPNQKWPAHYGNNGKITYEGKSEGLNFGDTERLTPPYDTLFKKIKFVQKFINIELGLQQIVTAMNEANIYPFRQGASKIIILINSTPCPRSPIFPFSIQVPRSINVYRYYRENGLKFFLVTPLAGLTLDKADGKPKTVVGFDSNKVYYFSDAKKKDIEGNAADRTSLVYESDLCLAFSQYYGDAAFSSQNLIDAKPEQKKKFVQVVSQRIVQAAIKEELTEDCACLLKSGRFPSTKCTVAARDLKGR